MQVDNRNIEKKSKISHQRYCDYCKPWWLLLTSSTGICFVTGVIKQLFLLLVQVWRISSYIVDSFLSERCVRVDLLWSRFFIYAISLCQSCAWFCSHFFDWNCWHVCETESQFNLEDGLECWFHVIAFCFQIYWILVSKMKKYFQFSTFEQVHYHTNLRYKGWLVIVLYQKIVEVLALVFCLPILVEIFMNLP